MNEGFCTDKYLEHQIGVFTSRIDGAEGDSFIEFGGKPFGDHHAERVLPGYDPHCKGEIIKGIVNETGAKVVMVVNALDILSEPTGRKANGRIRGDTGLYYDKESLRMIQEAGEKGFHVEDLVIAVTPEDLSEQDTDKIGALKLGAEKLGVQTKIHFRIPGYPQIESVTSDNRWLQNEKVHDLGRSLIAISPGGGSGKFGVLFSEIKKYLQNGGNPNFIKFETFPVFNLYKDHPLNLAFEAATADLGNKVLELSNGQSGYDKDEDNFRLLRCIYVNAGKNELADALKNSTDMGINMIHSGIIDQEVIFRACANEIERRIKRYWSEYVAGEEKIETYNNTLDIKKRFYKIAPSINLTTKNA